MTKKKSLLTTIFLLIISLLLPLAFMAALPTKISVNAASTGEEYSESVSITNSSFNAISSTYYEGDFSGWTRRWGNTGARTMIIDIQNRFDNYSSSTYYLQSNPGKVGNDNKILMINSANTSPNADSFNPRELSEGYISDSISLSANSYYEFQVSMKTQSFSEANPFGSIYISGLTDENGDDIDVSVEYQTASNWTTYYFYIATGDEAQSVTVDLWLGTETRPSTGVVFFDEVRAVQLSQNAFYKNMQLNDESGISYVLADSIEDRNIIDTDNLNFNFEKSLEGSINNLVDWNVTSSSVGGHAQILNLNQGAFEDTTGFAYPGSDFSANNTQALALWATDSNVTVTSQPFEIKSLGLYKITLNVKTSELTAGDFTVSINETNAIKDEFSYLSSYELGSATSSSITENSSNNFLNGYTQLTFYVQGHDRYNSQVELSLNLGTTETPATGAVIVDNITVEVVSSEDFSTDGNILQLATASAGETLFTNGYFNSANNQTNSLDLPIAPADWTISQPENNGVQEAGIINVYSKYFDEYDFEWANSLANPGSPDAYSSTDDVNNILMLYNQTSNYQSITSSTFSLEANTYYSLTFRYKTLGNAWFNVRLTDDDNIVLLNQTQVSNNDWSTYQCFIYTGEGASTSQITIEFGTEDDQVSGYAFFDNFEISTATAEQFDAADVQIDLSGFMLNLDPNEEIVSNITSSNAYTGSISSGDSDAAKGGIIKGEGNDAFEYVNEEGEILPIDDGSLTKNVLVIQTDKPSTYTLTSNFTISADADTAYYALTFRLLTSFPSYPGSHIHDDEEVDTNFGVTIGLNDFDKIQGLKSSNGWTEYTILFNVTEDKDVAFTFSLVSDCRDTTGYAFLTDIAWTESDAETYNSASRQTEFNQTLFTTSASASTDTDDGSGDSDSTDTTTDDNLDETLWLLIPSIILAVALIFAIVAFALKHVKFKKAQKITKQNYDRDESLHADIITNQAKQIQKAEIEKVGIHMESIKSQIAELEQQNKETIAKSREQGKVTSSVEKQFRSFAQKRAALQKTLDELGEHKAFIETKDYLITIEKRILASKKKQSKQPKK